MTATSKTVSGRDGKFSGPAEYAFARRFRHKMLLSYLCQQRLYPTFQSMVQQTNAHMCGDHLRRLVVRGQWGEALHYVGRFNARKTVASNALHFFLHTVFALDNVAAGAATNGSVAPSAHRHGMALSLVLGRCPRLYSIVRGMVESPQQYVSLDWESTRVRAASLAYFLARQDPDLDRLMRLPGDARMLPHQVLPINPRRRQHVKRPPGRRARGASIARLYLSKRRSLLPSSNPHTPAFMDESLNRVADLVDECLKAGNRQKLHQQPGFVLGFPMSLIPNVPS